LAANPFETAGSSNNLSSAEEKPIMKIQRLDWAGIKVQVGKTTVFVDVRTDINVPLKLKRQTVTRSSRIITATILRRRH
jgi:hypothetical protein